jgi:hypothetical protein
MPNNGRTSDDENGGLIRARVWHRRVPNLGSVAARGGEAITATLTGAVEQVTRDVSETGSKLVDAVDHAVGDAAGEAARSIAHGAEATSDALARSDGRVDLQIPRVKQSGRSGHDCPGRYQSCQCYPSQWRRHAGEASNDAPAAQPLRLKLLQGQLSQR